jgi:hypothetical protein
LTGANGSGKTTWIDALLTLMVPERKYRFYNQSSGTERKGDRSEETYVLGNYGDIQNEPLIRIFILDPAIAAAKFSGISDLLMKQSDFENLDLAVKNIIIMENKTNFNNIYNFLALPQLKDSMAIFGKGFGVGALKNAPWLKQVRIYYWGDIDAQGFQILSQLRSYFPQVQSLMMDFETLNSFDHECVAGTLTNVESVAYLTEDEKQVFDLVKAKNIRLEQEKISYQFARDYIGRHI